MKKSQPVYGAKSAFIGTEAVASLRAPSVLARRDTDIKRKPTDDDILVTLQLNWLDPTVVSTARIPWIKGVKVAHAIPHVLVVPEGVDVAIWINGNAVTLLDAECYELRKGDAVLVKVVPRGGGGGGKNPMAMIAMAAVMVAAVASQQYYLAAYGTKTFAIVGGVAYQTGFTTGSMIASAAVAAGVGLGGAALVNSVFNTALASSS